MMTEQSKENGDYYINPDMTLSVDKEIISIMAEKILPIIKGPKVLEMGVGVDVWTKKIINKFGHSYVVDISNKLIDKVKKYGRHITLYNTSFEEFETTIKFDTIMATFILEHVKDPIKILQKTKKFLKNDGQIIISVPNANSFHRIYGVCLGVLKNTTELDNSDIKLFHKRVYTQEKLENDIKKAGLRIIKRVPSFTKFLPNAQMNFSHKQLIGLFDLASSLPLYYGATLIYVVSI